MQSKHLSVARTCLDGAHHGTMDFPGIVGLLAASGFDGYMVDYRSHTTTYYHTGGGCITLENGLTDGPEDGPVAARFDPVGVAAQIRWAQANPPDYSYPAFSRNVKALGCAGYIVSFPGRRVLYFGRTAETHVELFPQQGDDRDPAGRAGRPDERHQNR